MDIHVTADGTLRYDCTEISCAIGRGGIISNKTEGDGATPVGCYQLRRVLYRSDRVARPETALEARSIMPNDGWCDDPADPNYNKPVMKPYPASAESLWRDDGLYDVIVILGHNDDPPISGAGSAIFLHVARPDFGPTDGCVAVSLSDLIGLLKICGDKDRICINASPAAQK